MFSSIFDLPLREVGRIEDPPALDVALARLAHVEVLEGPAVHLARGDEVHRALRRARVDREERLGGAGDRRHPRGGRAAGRLAVEPVALEQGEHVLEVVEAGIGDARVAPGRDLVGQRRLHLVGVAVALRRAHVDRLDDRALVEVERLGHAVEPVHGDGVEAALAHGRDVGGAPARGLLGGGDVALHSGGGGRRLGNGDMTLHSGEDLRVGHDSTLEMG